MSDKTMALVLVICLIVSLCGVLLCSCFLLEEVRAYDPDQICFCQCKRSGNVWNAPMYAGVVATTRRNG